MALKALVVLLVIVVGLSHAESGNYAPSFPYGAGGASTGAATVSFAVPPVRRDERRRRGVAGRPAPHAQGDPPPAGHRRFPAVRRGGRTDGRRRPARLRRRLHRVVVLPSRRPGLPRSFRIPFTPVTPAIGVIASVRPITYLRVETWPRFAAWFPIGLAVHFGCSYRRSAPAGQERRAAGR